MNLPESNGWSSWGKHVLKTLEDNVTEIKTLSDKITSLEVSVGKLQVQAGIWGAGASLIVAIFFKIVFK